MNRPLGILADTAENRELRANVHPDDWINPLPSGRYNLVVLGGGPAGLVCAAGAAGLGARVALVEQRLLGGDCLNDGCIPSKTLVRAARAVYDARNAGAFGIQGCDGLVLDFDAVMTRMQRVRADISRHDSARRFRDELGVDVYFGHGRFSGRDCIEVDGRTLRFRKAALCTGGRPSAPAIAGLAEHGYLTSETVFSLKQLPRRLAIIGAGAIGCELAQTFARFGSQVTLIDHAAQILAREDRDAAGILHRALEQEGMQILLNACISSVERRGGERVIHIESSGRHTDVFTDVILVGAGRAPNLEGLGLESAGIACNKGGVTVNDFLQTTNPDVYAAGDVCSPYKFTHSADAQARILIANALFRGRQRVSALTIPWCIYTDPEIAHVGMNEQEARDRDMEIDTLTVQLADNDRAVLEGESVGFARVHLRKGTDRIMGATIVARHAGEMIGEFSLAISNGLGLGAIARTIHPYPTQAEVVKKLADMYNRRRLTPFVKRLLSGWLKWQRG